MANKGSNGKKGIKWESGRMAKEVKANGEIG